MSLRFPDLTVPTGLATYSQDRIDSLTISEEDRKHLDVLAEERQRYLRILFELTGEAQPNEYVKNLASDTIFRGRAA